MKWERMEAAFKNFFGVLLMIHFSVVKHCVFKCYPYDIVSFGLFMPAFP
jgi:hypothetical protein